MTNLHIAWLRFKDGVTDAQIERHLAACRSLPEKVPVMIDLQCGANFTDRAAGYTHGIVVTLPNRDAIDAYLQHPEHIKVVEPLAEDVADLLVMDVQID
ncbi:MAG: Dabb family protein [Thermoleophilaceae bacterium]